MSDKRNRTNTLAADQTMIDGINKNIAKLPASFSVGSQTMTPAQLITMYQGRITATKAVVAAESVLTAAVKANKAQRASTAALALAFRQLTTAMFKESPDVLGDFGLAAPKPPQKSAATKASAAVKGDATRKTLGTKGSVQKKEALAQAAVKAAAPVPSAAPVKPAI